MKPTTVAPAVQPNAFLRKRGVSLLIGALLLIFGILAVTQRPATYYPIVEIEAQMLGTTRSEVPGSPADTIKLGFLFDARPTLRSCEALTGNIARVTLAQCPTCAVRRLQCLQTLDTTQQALLTEEPIDIPSGRMSLGVVAYLAADLESALGICEQAERQSSGTVQPIKCYASNTPRLKPAPRHLDTVQIGFAVLAFVAAMFGAWLVCWLIVKYEHLHAHLSHDHTDSGPQKFHAVPTPRIGGIGLLAGLAFAGGVMMLTEKLPQTREFGLLLLAGSPAFLGGLIEDVTKKVGVIERLLLTMLSGAIAAWLLGAVLNHMDIPGVDLALVWLPFAVVLTVFAVGGVANAINIIDGYNGLAGGYALIVLVAISVVGGQLGDLLVFPAALAMAGALLGFLKWNWPGGRIFLGDGGAYLLGFILAELSVLLVARNPSVSPWFPLLLLIHPIFETLFSIYRRKIHRGHTPGHPDALHLHQLVYSRLVRCCHVSSRNALEKLKRNNRVAPYFWRRAAMLAVLGGMLQKSTPLLALSVIGYSIYYFVTYRRIIQWKAARFGRFQ